jgi:hypothetical protein
LNKLDDVELVRFGYNCMRLNTRFPTTDPGLLSALKAMRRTGGFDQDLADVIVAHQRSRGGTQDGIVSVARISATSKNRERYDGAHSWIIVALDNNMVDVAADVYPRIDKHPDSGFGVSSAVKKVFDLP